MFDYRTNPYIQPKITFPTSGGLQGGALPMAQPVSNPYTFKPNSVNRTPNTVSEPSKPVKSGPIADIIARAAEKYGLDPSTMQRIAQIESGMNPRAQNPNSSAGGLFQFIDSTAKDYGLTDKMDAVQSAYAAARLAADNREYLRKTLGRDPTAGELYLAHQQGAGGAAKILQNPNALAVDVVGQDAVRLNGGKPDMTAGEFARLWTRKMGDEPNNDTIAAGSGSDTLAGGEANDTFQPTPAQIQATYDAFINGEMTPEEATAYQADVQAGRMPTPQALPVASDITPAQIQATYDAFQRGEMTPQEVQEYTADVQAGRMSLPAGATLSPVAPVSQEQAASEFLNAQNQGYGEAVDQAAGFLTGIPRGAAMLAGLPSDLGDLATSGLNYLFGLDPLPESPVNSQNMLKYLGAATGGLTNRPSNAGQRIGEFVGAGGRNVPLSLIQGLTSEGAGQLAKGTDYESAARIGGAILGGIGGGAATGGVKSAPTSPNPIVEAGGKAGVNVMTSDIMPPKTWTGKTAQAIGERIPLAGTGAQRATQASQRKAAIVDIVAQYGGDAPLDDILKNVSNSLLSKRTEAVKKYATAKKEVIGRLSSAGPVDMKNTLAAIDDQIAPLVKMGTKDSKAVVSKLQEYSKAIKGKDLATIERLRAELGTAFSDVNMAAGIRDQGTKALTAIYAPLRDDMGNFIKANGQRNDYTKWMVANNRLADLTGELKVNALSNVLKNADQTPETVAKLLFSNKSSDVALLYKNLSQEGRLAAQSAVLAKAMEKAGEEVSSPKFLTSLDQMGRQIGIVFQGADKEAVKGFQKLLRATSRADQSSVSPSTGAQTLPVIGGAGAASLMGGVVPGLAAIGATGGLFRVYESTAGRKLLQKLATVKVGSPEEFGLLNDVLIMAREGNKDGR